MYVNYSRGLEYYITFPYLYAFNDSRLTVAENNTNYSEAIGHLRASHETAENISDYVTLGDFNSSPTDNSVRNNIISNFCNDFSYDQTDLGFYQNEVECSHKSGRLIVRIITSSHLSSFINSISINKYFVASDHFPIIANFSLPNIISQTPCEKNNISLNWKTLLKKLLSPTLASVINSVRKVYIDFKRVLSKLLNFIVKLFII